MDESFYASLLQDNGDGDESSNSSQSPTLLSIILSRRTNTTTSSSGSVQIAVAARIPRKRHNHADTVKYTLKYYSFLDDRRRFTNLDALLTILAPVGVVHLSCTESAEINSSKKDASKAQQKRAREISKLLSKLSNVIESRTDILPTSSSSSPPNNKDDAIVVNLIPTLPKTIGTISSNKASSTSSMDSTLMPLLGGVYSPRYQAYKNDTKLMDDDLSKQCLALLLHSEQISSSSSSVVEEKEEEDGNTGGEYEVLSGDLTSHLTMDRTATECINLLPTQHKGIATELIGGSQSNNSIFGVLNKCKTKMGVRALEMWLRQPCVELDKILRRQDAVRKMVEENGLGRDRLRDEGLGGMRGVDLDGLCARLNSFVDLDGDSVSGSTSKCLEGLYKLHLFADQQLPLLAEALSDLIGDSSMEGEENRLPQDDVVDNDTTTGALEAAMAGLKRVMNELSRSTQLVEAVLDFDAAPRQFLVKPTFNEDLGEIRAELDSMSEDLAKEHKDMNDLWARETGQSTQVRLETTDNGATSANGIESSCAWQFRLPDTNASKELQKGEFKHTITVHRLLKNGVYFSTKGLRQLGNKKHDLLAEYDRHQREIVQNAMSVAVTYIPVLERASEIVAELDVLASLAHVAAFSPHTYCKPEMTDSDEDGLGIELTEARHPCVELQDNVDFIPNDFNMVYGSSSFLLVTGPNMGGKSTYIRSLGAIITMAQIGSYVPCSSAKINIVHHILARVGAGDVQDRGISTFMAEMLEASSILRTATKRSLIIIDELGRGTSTFDGFGLASSISEYIVQRIGCMTVFATHFHELTDLEEKEKMVKNCHVTAQRSTDGSNSLSFLYEVKPGPCLESFGIQVAEMANCPATVIMEAKRKAKELEIFDYSKKMKTDHNRDNKFEQEFKSLPLQSFQTAQEKINALKSILQ